MARYKVINDIQRGWETGANVGDILTIGRWNGELTLMKEGKAVCDPDSKCAKDNCVKVD